MELNDLKIKNLISGYQNGNEKEKAEAFRQFKSEIEIYIYNFPRMAYKKNLDICSEFFLYLSERLHPIIKNYPAGEELKFKTWFNYVLRNHFLNFWKYSKKEIHRELCIDDYENEICLESFENENLDFRTLKESLGRLDDIDRIIIKYYYMPETLEPSEIKKSCEIFRLTVQEALMIQKNLITARCREIEFLRSLSEKIGGINEILTGLKHRLHVENKLTGDDNLKLKNEILQKIARHDNTRQKYLRMMNSDGALKTEGINVFNEFSVIFKNISKARNCLRIAMNKLKAEIILSLKTNNEGVN